MHEVKINKGSLNGFVCHCKTQPVQRKQLKIVARVVEMGFLWL